jgi:hypothetical protein
MTWCDERLSLDPAAEEMSQAQLAQAEVRLAALPLADLVRGWREVGTAGVRARTQGCCCFLHVFRSARAR